MTVVHLEPFREAQIKRWLDIWNAGNAAIFGNRELQPLPVEAVMVHRHLAEQPLLLLMLALYDCDSNGLQRDGQDLSTPDLYERLLTRFALREVGKGRPALTPDQTEQAVEEELRRLSIAALAMFNRGRQWVTQAELDTDLSALNPVKSDRRNDFQAPITPG